MDDLSNNVTNETVDLDVNHAVSNCQFMTILPYLSYIIFGCISFVGNLMLSIIIMKHKELRRKELLVFWGLTFSDTIFGLGAIITGCRRTQLSCTGRALELVSTRTCQSEIHPVLLQGAGQHSGLVLVLLSIDRLLAIVAFDVYIGLTKTYGTIILVSAYAFTFVSMAYGVILGYMNSDVMPLTSAFCSSSRSVSPEYSRFSFLFTVGCSIASCVIYIFVVLANFVRAKKIVPMGGQPNSIYKARMKTQKRLTVTLGLSTTFTFFFHTIPYSILALGTTHFAFLIPTLGNYAAASLSLNASLNVLIFVWRHRNIRKAICCAKQANVNLTTAAPTASRNAKSNQNMAPVEATEKGI